MSIILTAISVILLAAPFRGATSHLVGVDSKSAVVEKILSGSSRELSLADRVAYQYAIEEVYWRHRIWPKENPGPKPPLDAIVSRRQIEDKVEEYLRKSQLIADRRGPAITGSELQTELERMAHQTRHPDVLGELFEALGNDPFVLAECLAKPTLAERLASSPGLYDGAKALSASSTLTSDTYTLPAISTSECVSGDSWAPTNFVDAPTGREWHTAVWTGTEMIVWGGEDRNLSATNTGGRYDPALDSWVNTNPMNAPDIRSRQSAVWTGIEVIVWGGASNNTIFNNGGRYNPAADAWVAASTTNAPLARLYHTAVWTGSEMVVWGGYGCGGNCVLNTGGRYNPNTDSWTPTSTTNAAHARWGHTAVWAGSEMIVWGGTDPGVTNYLQSGGRYDPRTDSWTSTSLVNVPTKRIDHTAVWTGDHMIVWGGSDDSFNVVNTGGRYDPSTDSWMFTTTGNAPSPRGSHTAVWTGTEMIVWGGSDSNTGGRYNAASDSWTSTSTANAPAARGAHTAVWTGSEMIIWGGSANYPLVNTGGSYCVGPSSTPPPPVCTFAEGFGSIATLPPSGWVQANNSNPIGVLSWFQGDTTVFSAQEGNPNSYIAVNYNSGSAGSTISNWLLTPAIILQNNAMLSFWTRTVNTPMYPDRLQIRMSTNGNSANVGSSATDVGDFTTLLLDINPAYTTTGYPSAWTNFTVTLSNIAAPVEGRLAFHYFVENGGPNGVNSDYIGIDTVQYGCNGSLVTPTPGPSPTVGPTASPTPIATPTGTSTPTPAPTASPPTPTSTPPCDIWTPINTTGAPSARTGHSVIWTGSEMIVWGGFNGGSYLSNGGRYNPNTDTWTPISTTLAPAARSGHTAVWTGSEMIIWGGNAQGLFGTDTGARYNPATDIWTATSIINVPTDRYDHTAVWTGSEMIVWGGQGDGFDVRTGGRYIPGPDTEWIPTSITGAPSARDGHTAVWTGSQMIVWGGSNSSDFSTGGRYNPGTDSWTATSTTGAPVARFGHTAVWTGNEMIVWGGFSGSAVNTGGRYDVGPNNWIATSTSLAPSARSGHTAVWTGSEMIVWGGINGNNPLSTGGRYDPNSDSWTATSTTNAPSARSGHTAVWTGSQMIVWGGTGNSSSYLNTGARYCAQSGPTPTPPPPSPTPIPCAVFAYVPDAFGVVAVINTCSNQVIAQVPVPGSGEGVAVNPAGTRVYVTGYEHLSVIDTSTNSVVAIVPWPSQSDPQGVAISPDGTRAYVVNQYGRTVSVIDTSTNTIVATTPQVGLEPYGVAVSPDGTRIYVTNSGFTTVSVIDTSTNNVVATVSVQSGPHGITVNPTGTRAYVANSYSNSVGVIDTSSNTMVATVSVGAEPSALALNPAGTRLYVTAINSVWVIDTSNNTVMATVPLAQSPFGVSITPDGTRVYVTIYNSNSVAAIDTASNTVVATIEATSPRVFGNFIATVPPPSPTPTPAPTPTPHPCAFKVLVVYADFVAPATLVDEIQSQPNVALVDVFNAGDGIPSLAQLQQYDIVVPLSRSDFQDAVTLGNNLADYVDGGGVVVQCGLSHGSTVGLGIRGRWLTGTYNPYSYSNSRLLFVRLGNFNGSHPLMADVTTLDSDDGNDALPLGSTEVAQTTEGRSLIAVRQVSGGHTTIGVTAYVGANTSQSGDWGKVVVNAGNWLYNCEPAPVPTPTPTPTSTPTPTPTPTGTPTLAPTPTPAPAQAVNLSTRVLVQTGDTVAIIGFIITGTDPMRVLLRGIGPSLPVGGALSDPILELHGPPGFTTIINDNWRDPCLAPCLNRCDLIASGIAPTNDLEAAICVTLDPGAYTAILRGNNNGTGVGLVEIYDLDSGNSSRLANLSTRGFVGTGSNVMISGFILSPGTNAPIVIRGLGPSLCSVGVPNCLADPVLELRDSDGTVVAMNDNCGVILQPRTDQPQARRGPTPNNCSMFCTNPLEACISETLPPGAYTAILAGANNGIGVGLLEVYDLGQ